MNTKNTKVKKENNEKVNHEKRTTKLFKKTLKSKEKLIIVSYGKKMIVVAGGPGKFILFSLKIAVEEVIKKMSKN